jgi:3-oxoacyl-[acyl-carrier protein] reductase
MASDVAVVTGGDTGIGLATSRMLLEAGYEVISLSLGRAPLDNPRMHSFVVDLTDRTATRKMAESIAARFSITTLIHNAGAIRPAPLQNVSLGDFDALVELHLAAAIILTQAVLPAMRAARFGRIVMTSSRAALGLATRTSYSATKAGMIGLARTWALELAPEGITVNVIAPGPIETDNFYSIIPRDSERAAHIAKSIPVRRLGQPDDVARAIMFLAAREQSFITGQVLYVCGGTSIGSLVL